MIDYKLPESHDVNDCFANLYQIVKYLRDPKDGCPWDKEQMPVDIIRSMQGEIYEYIEALDEKDVPHQREELGDVFLNLFLLTRIHEEIGDFEASDMLNEACEKYIRRHPHVFSDVKVSSTADVLTNWNSIKANQEGRKEDKADFFDNVPKNMPEMERCYKISKKAANIGFDWGDSNGVIEKVREELCEVENAQSQDELLDEIGDVLFSAIQIARKNHIKPQDALEHANNKFYKRFNHVYQNSLSDGLKLEELSDEQWDAYWKEAKKAYKS